MSRNTQELWWHFVPKSRSPRIGHDIWKGSTARHRSAARPPRAAVEPRTPGYRAVVSIRLDDLLHVAGFRQHVGQAHFVVRALRTDEPAVALDHPLGVPEHVVADHSVHLLEVRALGEHVVAEEPVHLAVIVPVPRPKTLRALQVAGCGAHRLDQGGDGLSTNQTRLFRSNRTTPWLPNGDFGCYGCSAFEYYTALSSLAYAPSMRKTVQCPPLSSFGIEETVGCVKCLEYLW